jgi:hypothetical protein
MEYNYIPKRVFKYWYAYVHEEMGILRDQVNDGLTQGQFDGDETDHRPLKVDD